MRFADPDDLLAHDPFHERLEELRTAEGHSYQKHFTHEDGSHTFIMSDPEPEHANPRNNDGNLVHLVNLNRDYRDLDDPDSGINEARERWDYLHHNGIPHYRWPDPERTYWNDVQRLLIRKRFTREDMVKRYVAMFRPDIVHYEDAWEVTGVVQGDWQDGYAYITREDFEGAGFTDEHRAHYPDFDFSPAGICKQELDVYALWFAQEVYGAITVKQGDPIVRFGEQGAYIDGYEPDEDACWGFLAYPSEREMAEQVNTSPIVTEEVD